MTATIPAPDLAAVKKIDGWLSDREAGLLWSCARYATGPIIEIGSHEGRSTAALALGSRAGSKLPIFAIDSFVGCPSRHGRQAAVSSCNRLRANLDAIGVNGEVTIIPKSSRDAVLDVPQQCGLLFVDGSHEPADVASDLKAFLPFVADGGTVVMHDFAKEEPGVMDAAMENILSRPDEWRVLRRCDSCLVARKEGTQQRTVMLAIPAARLEYGAAQAIMQATFGGHKVFVEQSGHGWDDMDELWVRGLNAAMAGEITHFAMLHADVIPQAGWLDCLLSESYDLSADMVSAVVPIKDARGLTSCGIGHMDDPWSAHRRFTMRELTTLPETFGLLDAMVELQGTSRTIDFTGKYLLHNTGCWVADLRNPAWFTTEGPADELVASFAFNIRSKRLASGAFRHERESEDWYFSRRIAGLDLKALATRKVELWHDGPCRYPNFMPWGEWECDLETRRRWGGEVPCPH